MHAATVVASKSDRAKTHQSGSGGACNQNELDSFGHSSNADFDSRNANTFVPRPYSFSAREPARYLRAAVPIRPARIILIATERGKDFLLTGKGIDGTALSKLLITTSGG